MAGAPQAKLECFQKKLLVMDRFWSVDRSVLTMVSGECGGKMLRTLWESRCLATADQEVDIEGARSASSALMGDAIYKWASEAVQNEINVAHGWLVRLKEGQPVKSSDECSGWLASVFAKLPFFARCKNDMVSTSAGSGDAPEGSGLAKEYLHGAEALTCMFAKLRGKTGLTLPDLQPFSVWKRVICCRTLTKTC